MEETSGWRARALVGRKTSAKWPGRSIGAVRQDKQHLTHYQQQNNSFELDFSLEVIAHGLTIIQVSHGYIPNLSDAGSRKPRTVLSGVCKRRGGILQLGTRRYSYSARAQKLREPTANIPFDEGHGSSHTGWWLAAFLLLEVPPCTRQHEVYGHRLQRSLQELDLTDVMVPGSTPRLYLAHKKPEAIIMMFPGHLELECSFQGHLGHRLTSRNAAKSSFQRKCTPVRRLIA